MRNLRILSASEQVASHIKEEIRRRTWTDTMPGESWLVKHLQVGRDTVRGAMTHLEEEGVLISTGQGRRRKIVMDQVEVATAFKVTLLLYAHTDFQDADIHQIVFELNQRGYEVAIAPKSLMELGMKVGRVAKMVEKIVTDAWVICAGSADVLTWFSERTTPAFALFGRFPGQNMAGIGPDKFPAYQTALRRLVELGHRRIVLLMPEQARKPFHSAFANRILDEMKSLGITVGNYMLPDWEVHPDGLRNCLDRLFKVTPPTAIFIEEAHEFFAVRHYLAERGIFAPNDVSLICSDDNPAFNWSEPLVSCIRWSIDPLVRRVIRWTDTVASGKDDSRKSFSKAVFIEGGTVGPARIG